MTEPHAAQEWGIWWLVAAGVAAVLFTLVRPLADLHDETFVLLFVGVLILMFSVLFPVTKLICTTIFLFARKRSGKFVRYMAFNSAKWSMADVMVIAIFMAYVGFKSILDNQLKDITMETDTINVLTTTIPERPFPPLQC